MMTRTLRIAWVPILLVFLSGCFPTACNRTESRALMPRDSLSRTIARALPVDTLEHIASFADDRLAYPRTLGYAPDGRLWVADTREHRVMRESGGVRVPPETRPASTGSLTFSTSVTLSGKYPYLAGFISDTTVVYSPADHEMLFLQASNIAGGIRLEGERPTRGGLHYAVVTDSGFAIKILGEDFDGYAAKLDRTGELMEKKELPGPTWRHAGLLRYWDHRILSLNGYRPVVDVWDAAGLDSLELRGFDSPMLSRMRNFLLGDVDQPPLLTAAAAPLGDRLFVLNMRPGWLRVDVYDREGNLTHILTQPDPQFNQEFFPTDLAVRELPDGTFEISVAVIKPEPRIDRYRWTASAPAL